MPTGLDYNLDPLVANEAAYASAEEIAAAEDQWRRAQLAERARQFDTGLDYNAQVTLMRDDLARAELGQRGALAGAELDYRQGAAEAQFAGQQMQLEQQALQQGDLADYRNRQLEQQGQQSERAYDRDQMRLMAQLQEQQQQRTFEQALSSQKAINDYKGFTSQGQFDEAVGQWEQQYGMDWSFPERAIAERASQDFAQERQRFVGGLSALTGLEPEVLDSFVMEGEGGMPQLTVDPRLVVGMGESRMNDQRLRELKEADLQLKREQEAVDLAKTEATEQKTQTTRQKQLVSQFLSADAKYQAAVNKPASLDGTPAPKPQLGAMGYPTISDDEFVLLPEGAIFSDVNGSFYKKLNGVARPISE